MLDSTIERRSSKRFPPSVLTQCQAEICLTSSWSSVVDDNQIWQLFEPLFEDMAGENEFPNRRPLLAHYTSLQVVESILANDEIWFSNPLLMNDSEEVRFGYIHGAQLAKESIEIRSALATEERHAAFAEALDGYIAHFEENNLLDTYVFCLSEHSPDDFDSLLSMWRGYGGNGKGAAIVIDTSKIEEIEESPLLILRVRYGSEDQRRGWIRDKITAFAEILERSAVPDEKIHLASAQLHEVIKLFALTTKHHGFEEEQEWRVVYLSDRDEENKLKDMLGYFNGPRGLEPKLRLKITPKDGVTPGDLSFDRILAAVLLGPNMASPISVPSISRMLDLIGKPELKDRIIASSIPFRTL